MKRCSWVKNRTQRMSAVLVTQRGEETEILRIQTLRPLCAGNVLGRKACGATARSEGSPSQRAERGGLRCTWRRPVHTVHTVCHTLRPAGACSRLVCCCAPPPGVTGVSLWVQHCLRCMCGLWSPRPICQGTCLKPELMAPPRHLPLCQEALSPDFKGMLLGTPTLPGACHLH